MNRKIFLIGAGLLAFPWPAEAKTQPQPFLSGNGPAVSFRSFEDDHGGFYLAWTSGAGPQSLALRAQHVDAEGHSSWDPAGIIVSPTLSSGEDWSGLADGQGGISLFWDESDGVHAQRFRLDGSRRRPGNSVLMSTSTAIQPDAVADAGGGTLVVWREMVSDRRSVIMAQHLDQEGKPTWRSGGMRVSLRASHQTNPRVVYDNMSGMIVAWRDEANDASELRVGRIDFAGNRLWGAEGLKITAPIGKSEFPTLTSVGTGGAVLAWTGSVEQTSQIFLQAAGPEAALKWNPAVAVSTGPTTFNRWNPVLLGDETRWPWIAWEDFHNQLNYLVELNHLSGDGASVWPGGEITVAPAQGDQGKTAITSDGNDGVWLAWIDNRLATIGLYMQEVDDSGARILGEGGRLVADHLSKPSRPQLVTLSAARVAVIWADRPKKDAWTLSWSILETP